MKKKLRATELASLNEIEQMVDEALAEVRTVSDLLHPPVLNLLKIHDDGVGFGDNCQQGIGIAGFHLGPHRRSECDRRFYARERNVDQVRSEA